MSRFSKNEVVIEVVTNSEVTYHVNEALAGDFGKKNAFENQLLVFTAETFEAARIKAIKEVFIRAIYPRPYSLNESMAALVLVHSSATRADGNIRIFSGKGEIRGLKEKQIVERPTIFILQIVSKFIRLKFAEFIENVQEKTTHVRLLSASNLDNVWNFNYIYRNNRGNVLEFNKQGEDRTRIIGLQVLKSYLNKEALEVYDTDVLPFGIVIKETNEIFYCSGIQVVSDSNRNFDVIRTFELIADLESITNPKLKIEIINRTFKSVVEIMPSYQSTEPYKSLNI